jgi:hypothetical protein
MVALAAVCAECDHVGGRPWVVRVRRSASLQFCGIDRGRFRRMPDGDHGIRQVDVIALLWSVADTVSRGVCGAILLLVEYI